MVGGSRFKEYNSGGVIPLLSGNLFRASFFPRSRGVHQVKILGDPNGDIEYGEYLIRQGASHFNHSKFCLAPQELVELQRRLGTLRQMILPTDVHELDEEDEEPLRRSIQVWVGGERRGYYLVADHSPLARTISGELRAAFESAWRAIADPIRNRRARDFADVDRDA